MHACYPVQLYVIIWASLFPVNAVSELHHVLWYNRTFLTSAASHLKKKTSNGERTGCFVMRRHNIFVTAVFANRHCVSMRQSNHSELLHKELQVTGCTSSAPRHLHFALLPCWEEQNSAVHNIRSRLLFYSPLKQPEIVWLCWKQTCQLLYCHILRK